MVTSRATRITLVTRYLIGRLTCERHEREFCTRPFKITELEKGRWSWISNCSEAFHTDSWLAEANPGHSDRDAILQALLPGPRYGSTLGPGKARMRDTRPTVEFLLRRIDRQQEKGSGHCRMRYVHAIVLDSPRWWRLWSVCHWIQTSRSERGRWRGVFCHLVHTVVLASAVYARPSMLPCRARIPHSSCSHWC